MLILGYVEHLENELPDFIDMLMLRYVEHLENELPDFIYSLMLRYVEHLWNKAIIYGQLHYSQLAHFFCADKINLLLFS